MSTDDDKHNLLVSWLENDTAIASFSLIN